MSGRLTRDQYARLVAEDVRWLIQLPRTLERDHTIGILRDSIRMYYDDPAPDPRPPGITSDRVEEFSLDPVPRSCNRHRNCDEADRDTMLGHGHPAVHCDDSCCEDCFGY